MKFPSIAHNIPAALILSCTLFPGVSFATMIGGVEFPQGEISFADEVVSYDPAYSGVTFDCPFVSLGSSGQLVLQFVYNVLTGSDSSDLEL